MSILEKQEERFEKVLNECADFKERFRESKFIQEVERYKTLSNNFIKNQKNEQVKKAA
jgi:outer membrane protein assembly factor BamD